MNSETTLESACWYVIYTHARQEDRAESNLRAWKVETFTPKVKTRYFNCYTGSRYEIKPLFPRYIFARFNLQDLYHKIQYTRGVHSLVNFNGNPAPVGDEIIALMKSRIRDGVVCLEDRLTDGDKVLVEDGPLRSFTGIFERELKDTDRVRILLQTVNYQAHFEVDRYMIRKLGSPGYCIS